MEHGVTWDYLSCETQGPVNKLVGAWEQTRPEKDVRHLGHRMQADFALQCLQTNTGKHRQE